MNKKLTILAAAVLLLLGFSSKGMAGVSINIGFPLPPPFVFPAPPSVVVIPGTDVYYCPDVGVDIFFYGGNWYRSFEGRWYLATAYGGPWVYVASPPVILLSLPVDFRIIVRGERRIPFAEFDRNWRAWERDRYWEHHDWGRMEHERYQGIAPEFREGEHGEFRGGHPEGEFHREGGFRKEGGPHGGRMHEEHERR